MLGDMWSSTELTAEKLGITEIKLSFLRENGTLKPGIHWKSSPLGQKKPWKPKALYNIKMINLYPTLQNTLIDCKDENLIE